MRTFLVRTLEVLGLGLLPGITLTFLLLLCNEARLGLNGPFLARGVMPWFILGYGLPLALVLIGGLVFGLNAARARRAEERDLFEVLAPER